MASLCPSLSVGDQHPESLTSVPMKDQVRVSRDNLACDFILDELQALQDIADVIPYRTQEALVQSFVSLYPANFFVSFQFPMVEDLINSP